MHDLSGLYFDVTHAIRRRKPSGARALPLTWYGTARFRLPERLPEAQPAASLAWKRESLDREGVMAHPSAHSAQAALGRVARAAVATAAVLACIGPVAPARASGPSAEFSSASPSDVPPPLP